MTIRYTCVECGSVLKIKDDLADTLGHCPKCKAEFRVPAATATATAPASDSSHEVVTAAVAAHDTDVGIDTRVLSAADAAAEAAAKTDAELSAPPVLALPEEDDEAAEAATPEPAPPPKKAKAGARPAAHDDEFDPVAFLTDDAAPPQRKSAVLFTAGGGEPEAETEPRSRPRAAEPGPKAEQPAKKSSQAAAMEMWDHAKAAKQMRKAVKDSVSEAEELRKGQEPKFDYAGMFWEIGVKWGGALAFGVLLVCGLYWVFDQMMGRGVPLPPLANVTGVVTLDGKPVAGANVFFAPVAPEFGGGKHPHRARTSVATTDENGRYRMFYLDRTAGVMVGKCRVWVNHLNEKGVSDIPPEYGELSGRVEDVPAAGRSLDITLTSPTGRPANSQTANNRPRGS